MKNLSQAELKNAAPITTLWESIISILKNYPNPLLNIVISLFVTILPLILKPLIPGYKSEIFNIGISRSESGFSIFCTAYFYVFYFYAPKDNLNPDFVCELTLLFSLSFCYSTLMLYFFVEFNLIE